MQDRCITYVAKKAASMKAQRVRERHDAWRAVWAARHLGDAGLIPPGPEPERPREPQTVRIDRATTALVKVQYSALMNIPSLRPAASPH